MISKQIDLISKTDIDFLIENEVMESRSIEYKLELPGLLGDDRKEFLADVSSLWNACGFKKSANYDEQGNWMPTT